MGASEAPIPSYVQLENLRQVIVTHAVTQLCPIKKRLGLTGSFQLKRQRHSLPKGSPHPTPLGSCWQQLPAPKGFSLFPKDLKFNLYWRKPICLWTLDTLLLFVFSMSLYLLCSAHQDIAREAYNWERYTQCSVPFTVNVFQKCEKRAFFGVSNHQIWKWNLFLNRQILHQVPRQVTNYIEGCFIFIFLICIFLNCHLMDDYRTLYHKIGKKTHTHL
jgi:hypothetical protein